MRKTIYSHHHIQQVSDEDEDPLEKEARMNAVVRQLPDGTEEEVVIPKVTHATVLGISCKDLKSMHSFTKNSPAVILQCADFIESTSTQAYKVGDVCLSISIYRVVS